MAKFVIRGGFPLRGAIRLGGCKNSSFKLMIAAGLGDKESRLLNLANIGDVEVTELSLKGLGIKVERCGERTIFVRPNGLKKSKIPSISGEKTRASTLFAALLLNRLGRAQIPFPGGCVLGSRPIDRHLEAFRALGVKIVNRNKWYYLSCQKLKGTTFRFPKKTHTGTEAMILAAVKALGMTLIKNAGQEPEIDDLITFLNKMGADIKRQNKDEIVIKGVKHLGGAIHKIMPDRNEAVSYAVAALATKGDIVVEDARADDIKTFLSKVEEIGGKFSVDDYGIRFWYEKPLKATKITTAPEPGFMTDWQPLWTLLMTQANGTSQIIEAVHENRLQFTDQLARMGAKIELFNPKVKSPDKFYGFDNPDQKTNFHAVHVFGSAPLKAMDLIIPDLRAGATLTVAALIAKGKSTLSGVQHIDRGYEQLDERLRQLGANIKRVD
ncbi:UDP-N-acetylglucosamine 1-carboxyvinyltransferase [Candidatus Beckwithbacteria bacterium RBG_13_42_9]|uniref:UDP-N-acetylglucosamine 1-carboxyvinyltransferase n=1 Tax=Candidatus Beckwithbacteria bacterium RBG_13_42_9 TaxID=1797457 RepID=A0A1F5E7E6_9BACT|nr:MAG: UDP-N-acetylglucosamine 1-carboxyvinyltransferase [Candidatus Beckwithbacteria bacterium RBG_13_42_9]